MYFDVKFANPSTIPTGTQKNEMLHHSLLRPLKYEEFSQAACLTGPLEFVEAIKKGIDQ